MKYVPPNWKEAMQEELRQKLRSMNLQNADVLLVKGRELAEAVAQIPMPHLRNARPITIIMVDDVNNAIAKLNEDQMREAGWVRRVVSPISLIVPGS